MPAYIFSVRSFTAATIFSVFLSVGFARHQHTRSKRRTNLAATIAALARITLEDSRKLLPDNFYPSWVVFSEREGDLLEKDPSGVTVEIKPPQRAHILPELVVGTDITT